MLLVCKSLSIEMKIDYLEVKKQTNEKKTRKKIEKVKK